MKESRRAQLPPYAVFSVKNYDVNMKVRESFISDTGTPRKRRSPSKRT